MTVSEARAALPDVLDRVLAGEEVTITRHGKPVAVVVRPDRLRSRRADEAFGAAERIHALIADARRRPLGNAGLSVERAEDLVAEVRADRARS
jgi:antitoxin (DNA-binding transcriptional repressor) of toxin-antitoxin stability system